MRIKLEKALSLGEIADAVNGRLSYDKNVVITHITTDSRECFSGDLFIALPGKAYNGEDYTEEANSKGAITVSVSGADSAIAVYDCINALHSLAKYYKKFLSKLKCTVAITGSVGKSTTKEIVALFLRDKFFIHSTYENENNLIGVPLTILQASLNTEILVLEFGMNHHGEIARLANLGEPDVAVITNIGTAHIGNLGSREAIANAKKEIFIGEKKVIPIIPKNEPLLSGITDAITFSSKDPEADVFVKRSCKNKIAVYKKGVAVDEAYFETEGSHLLENISAALAVADALNVKTKSLNGQYSLINHNISRQKIVKVKNFYVFDDSYNASYESVLAAFGILKDLRGYGKRSILIGTLLELGSMSETIHFKIGLHAGKNNFNKLFFIGKYAKIMRSGAIHSGHSAETIFINENEDCKEVTAQQIAMNAEPEEIILFKASHAVRISDVYKKHML